MCKSCLLVCCVSFCTFRWTVNCVWEDVVKTFRCVDYITNYICHFYMNKINFHSHHINSNQKKKICVRSTKIFWQLFNTLNAELNPICYLLALLAHHFLHVSRIRVKSLTLRLIMSYIYGAPILDVSRSHTTT